MTHIMVGHRLIGRKEGGSAPRRHPTADPEIMHGKGKVSVKVTTREALGMFRSWRVPSSFLKNTPK